ncbi:MAG: UDP-N-acetylmuramoyl-L-alanine--D-glutamate ligase, partial [Nitriliruptorales bacterium]|nr:UDP-N-acetylmuramoyl-L-alanine--D-glutamate ligase [Nitriliruptorales bacterium]
MSDVDGRRVLVIGAGRSGVAAARALLRHAAVVTVAESGPSVAARSAMAALRDEGARTVVDITGTSAVAFDLIVPSPGVPEHHPLLEAAAVAGVEVWSEPELAWRLAGGRTQLVAVSGTNGKTTTTELLAACLDAPAGGNIGTPLVTLLEQSPPPLVVAELSSFQLRFTQTLRPRVAVLLNVAPDHLDWH